MPSNGRGGLRIQFSRNPFGQRRSAMPPGGMQQQARYMMADGGAATMNGVPLHGHAMHAMHAGGGMVTRLSPGPMGTTLLTAGMPSAVHTTPTMVMGMGGLTASHSGLFGEPGGGVMMGVGGGGYGGHAVAEVTQDLAAASLFGQQMAPYGGF